MSTANGSDGTGTSQALLAAAEKMLPEIRAASADAEAARRLPDSLAAKLDEAGFFRMTLGRESGGLEVDPVTAAKVVEILSTASPSVGWVVMIIASSVFWVARVLPKEARDEVFPAGPAANIAGTVVPHGRADRVPGGWRVSGQWPFGSGCHHAAWLACGAWLHDGEGPVQSAEGRPEWRLFLVPASDCEILDTWHTSGLRGTGSHDFVVDGVFVPDRRVFPHPLAGAPVRPERHYAFPGVSIAMMSGVALGAARGAVDSLLELLEAKVDRRSGRLAAAAFDRQMDLAAAEALTGSARAYLYQTLEELWAAVMAGEEPSHRLRAQYRLACTNAVNSAVQAVDRAHSAAGTSAIYVPSALDGYFRDVHTVAAHAFVRPATLADGGLLLLGEAPLMPGF